MPIKYALLKAIEKLSSIEDRGQTDRVTALPLKSSNFCVPMHAVRSGPGRHPAKFRCDNSNNYGT